MIAALAESNPTSTAVKGEIAMTKTTVPSTIADSGPLDPTDTVFGEEMTEVR